MDDLQPAAPWSFPRRALLGGAAALLAGASLPAVRSEALAQADPALAPFLHGVASGDPLADRVVLWTRVEPPGPVDGVPVRWLVASQAELTDVVRSGTVVARPGRDWTVKVDVDGLAASTTYYYAFEALGRRSMVGRTRTAPAAGDTRRLRFAVATCSKYDSGFFNAYARIAEADVDAVLHLGDYIYEGRPGRGPAGRVPEPRNEVVTLAQYRQRFAHYRTDPDLQRLHQQHPMVATWDDHESANDSWAGGASAHDPETEGAWEVRKAAAQQVYDEWIPLRLPLPGDASRIYRRLPYGGLTELVVVDTRLEGRSRQLEGLDGDQIIVDPAVADPARQMYSPEQRGFLEQSLAGSPAAWKIVLNQVVVSQFRAVGLPRDVSRALAALGRDSVPSEGVALAADIWDGYVAERERLLGFLRREQVRDVVVLTGDIHVSLANDLTEDPFDPRLPPVAVEVVTPSVTSTNVDEMLGVPPRTTSLAIEAAIRVQNPSTKYAELDSNGWVLLDVTPERLQAEWWFVDTVQEPADGQRLDATWQVRRGAQRLSPGDPATAARDDRPAVAPAPVVVPVPPAGTGGSPGTAGQARSGRSLPATGSGTAPVAALGLAGAAAAAAVLRRRGAAADD